MSVRKKDYSPDDMLNEQLTALIDAVPYAVDVIISVLKSEDEAIKKQRTEIAIKLLSSTGIFDKLASKMSEASAKKLVNNLIEKFNKNTEDR